jgi:hypothetical protein
MTVGEKEVVWVSHEHLKKILYLVEAGRGDREEL